MVKVFLAEDEFAIREGIKNNINWNEEGFEFVGDASDGELAFPLIQQSKPDILITDIKMPFTDGLELSRLVKKEFPNIKIIILSGYNDFSFAREAIHIGVTAYILKPVSSEKLLHEVKAIAGKIEEEKKQQKYLNQFKMEMLENRTIAKNNFFNDLIFKELTLSEILERAEKLEISLIANTYNIVLFKIKVPGDTATCYSEDVVEITEKVQQNIEGNPNVLMFDRGAEGWAFLFKGNTNEQLEQEINCITREIIRIVSDRSRLEYFGGIGKCVKRLSELPNSYDKANKAFSYRYLGTSNQMVSYGQIEDNKLFLDQNMIFHKFGLRKVDRTLLENFLKMGNINDVSSFVSEYFWGLGQENMNSLIFRQYVVMDMYFCTISFVEELGYAKKEVMERYGGFHNIFEITTNPENAKKFVEQVVTEALRGRDNATMKRYESLIQQAKNYIHEFYSEEHISLNSVAASVNISPSYFSAIFSQEAGMTFIEYLTEVRMNKAKELLMCSTLKSSEIGFEIGYKDPHYFSYLFKKTQGCTPKEFRMRGRERCNKTGIEGEMHA